MNTSLFVQRVKSLHHSKPARRQLTKQIRHIITEPHRIRAYFFYLFHPHYPLFTPAATRSLNQLLKPGQQVFEWGAGKSTIFFAKHGVQLISIEHDDMWHKKIGDSLSQSPKSTVDLKLIKPQQSSSQIRFQFLEDQNFYSYVSAINDYPDDNFDVVVVDGRERAACLIAAVSKVKKGGLLILDDSQRERYQPAINYVKKLGWAIQPHPFGFNKTTFFTKPI